MRSEGANFPETAVSSSVRLDNANDKENRNGKDRDKHQHLAGRSHPGSRRTGGILATSALLALLALSLPTRRALRSHPVEALGVGE